MIGVVCSPGKDAEITERKCLRKRNRINYRYDRTTRQDGARMTQCAENTWPLRGQFLVRRCGLVCGAGSMTDRKRVRAVEHR